MPELTDLMSLEKTLKDINVLQLGMGKILLLYVVKLYFFLDGKKIRKKTKITKQAMHNNLGLNFF